MGTGSLFMDFEGGHHLPLKDAEAKDLCNLILEAWNASGGGTVSRVPSGIFLQNGREGVGFSAV